MKKSQLSTSFVLAVFFTLLSLKSRAQDLHFSNAEYSPLTLNPALSGANSTLQAIVNYRNQWNSIASPYQTVSASVDGRFNDQKRNKRGILAGGLNVYNDRVGDLQLSNSAILLNVAYHLVLNRKSTIGIGLNGGFGQQSISINNAKWSNQYDGSAFNANLGGEILNNLSHSYIDAGAGVLYAFRNDLGSAGSRLKRINAGAALYHVNQPKMSYTTDNSDNLNMRASAFVNSEIQLAGKNGSILPGIYFHKQGVSSELLAGFNYKYTFSEGSMVTGFNRSFAVYMGLFNRLNDALILRLMLAYDQFMLGAAYDVNISRLSMVSRGRGGFELFLRFNMLGRGGL